MIVHYLWNGRTLCEMPGTPDTWPDDHRWVSAGDEGDVTCATCRQRLALRRRN